MRLRLVVALHPLPTDLPYLVQILEEPGIQYLVTVRPVEALDEGVLVGLARLDVPDLDPVILAPAHKDLAQEFRPVVAADRPGQPSSQLQALQHPEDPLSSQRGVNLYV